MQILAFGAFLLVSHVLLMQIFRFSTYHAYFWKTLPVLIGYSALVGWLLFAWRFDQFFLWQLTLASVWLFVIAWKQNKGAEGMLELAGDDADSVRLMAVSAARTSRYYAYSSFIYVIGFSSTYLYLYNR